MKLNEAQTEDDFIKIYKRKYGENPPTFGTRGDPEEFIYEIVQAVENDTPIDIPRPPEGADL